VAIRCSFIEEVPDEDGDLTHQNYRRAASVFARFHAKADDGCLAERLGGFQPVQALNQHETRAIRRTRIGVCWPISSILVAISSTRFCTSVARRLTGT
jgi:hypothetical protein